MNYEQRLRKLEPLRSRTSPPRIRVYHAIISPKPEVEGIYMRKRTNTSTAPRGRPWRSYARAMRAVGWEY